MIWYHFEANEFVFILMSAYKTRLSQFIDSCYVLNNCSLFNFPISLGVLCVCVCLCMARRVSVSMCEMCFQFRVMRVRIFMEQIYGILPFFLS